MNTQAAFKTMLVVLSIGAFTGFQEWRHTAGAPPEVRRQQAYEKCMKDRTQAAFREDMYVIGQKGVQQTKRFETECKFQASGAGIQLGQEASPPTGPTEVNGLHYSAGGQLQTQSREACMAQLEDDRKRSPHGLNPDWEKRQKGRCQELYSDAKK
jgi:hypothetical protein